MSEEQKTQATTTVTETAGPRVITIVTTVGQKVKIPFEGNRWDDLRKVLERGGTDVDGKSFSGYSLSNMKAVEGLKRTTLEHKDAVVPDGNFNLFLLPYKSKSGAMSRTEINAKIKEFIARDGNNAKIHFTDNGKNYTQVASAKLEELLESYAPGTKKASAKNKNEAISQVVESVKAAKANNDEDEFYAQLVGLSMEEKLDLVIRLLLDARKGLGNVSSAPAQEEAVETVKEKTPEEIEAERVAAEKAEEARLEKEKKDAEEKEKKRLQKIEDDELEKELAAMRGGLSDVR